MACYEYPQQPGTKYAGMPESSLPEWLRYVSATVLKAGTPTSVCTAAAGRHQRMQESSTPSTMSQWCQYFCITLNLRPKVKFDDGIPMDTLVKLLFDSGIPMAKLLPQAASKKPKKGNTPEKPAIPVKEKTAQNLTDEEVCTVSIDRTSM
jgi:hypothetical protein